MADTAIASPVKHELHNSRKNKKPLMEKRRRARINSCLTQLKALVLQAIKKDSSQFSKLEKADILELTVKHLRALQRQQGAGAMTSDPSIVSKYRAGFNECAKEVIRYMGSVHDVSDDVKGRVVGHLASWLQVVNHVTPAETLQQCMKPLHVQIPTQQQLNSSGTASAVILPSQAMNIAPSSLCSPLNSQTMSPVSVMSLQHNPSVSTATTTVISHNPAQISGAFKIVPSASCPGGAVALYLGNASMSRASDSMSVDTAVPLYSLSLPHSDGGVTAFVPPASTASAPTSTHHVTSHAYVKSNCGVHVSLMKPDYNSMTSLPVDLRQSTKLRASSFMGSMTVGQCSPTSMADEKLWRPW